MPVGLIYTLNQKISSKIYLFIDLLGESVTSYVVYRRRGAKLMVARTYK